MSYTTLQEIRIRLNAYDVVDDAVVFPSDTEAKKLDVKIEELIKKAKQDIRAYRRYPSDYTDERIDDDIEKKYHQIVIELVLYDLSIEGADFQTQHVENSTNRSFVKRESILGKVIPFCNIYSTED